MRDDPNIITFFYNSGKPRPKKTFFQSHENRILEKYEKLEFGIIPSSVFVLNFLGRFFLFKVLRY